MSKSHQLVAFLFGLFFSVSVSAQTTSFEAMMNGIIKSTPGITNVAVGTGVRTSIAGSVGVAADGLTIPVATTIAADVPYAAVAAGAGRIALRAVPWVGTAIALAEIGKVLNASGMQDCPAPGYFCKAGGTSTSVQSFKPTFYMSHSSGATSGAPNTSVVATCNAYVASRNSVTTNGYKYFVIQASEAPNPLCNYGWNDQYGNFVSNYPAQGVDLHITATCPDGTKGSTSDGWVTFTCTVTKIDVAGPATLEDVNKALSDKANADHDWGVKIKSQMDAVAQANPAMEPPVNVKTAPLVVTAPPVTTQPQTVSTRTISNPDGSTSTETVTKATTVTATQGSPSTVEKPNITYNPKTTTTTTTVNNTTNVTTTNTTTVNNSPVTVSSPQQKLDLPTDYNREATQQKILNVLNGEGMPTAALKSADPSIEQISAQNKVGLTTVDQVTDSGVGITNWFPKIATAQCRNPQVPNPITGNKVDVVICDKVDLFSAFVSGVIAVYCLFGCVREVTAAIKA
jgi:hypothetical protein